MRATVAGKRRSGPARSLASGALAISGLGLVLAAGCGPPAKVAPQPPPALRKPPAAGYDGRRDSLDSVDARVLRGRRAVGSRRRLQLSIGVETALGVAVILAAAVLADMQPAVHQGPA